MSTATQEKITFVAIGGIVIEADSIVRRDPITDDRGTYKVFYTADGSNIEREAEVSYGTHAKLRPYDQAYAAEMAHTAELVRNADALG